MGDKPQCPTWVGCKWCQPAALQAKKITVLALLSWEVKCTYISALFPSKQEKSVHHPRGAGGVLSPATDLSCSEMCSAHFCIALSAIGKPSLLLGFPQAGDAKKIQKWGGGGGDKKKQTKSLWKQGGKTHNCCCCDPGGESPGLRLQSKEDTEALRWYTEQLLLHCTSLHHTGD